MEQAQKLDAYVCVHQACENQKVSLHQLTWLLISPRFAHTQQKKLSLKRI